MCDYFFLNTYPTAGYKTVELKYPMLEIPPDINANNPGLWVFQAAAPVPYWHRVAEDINIRNLVEYVCVNGPLTAIFAESRLYYTLCESHNDFPGYWELKKLR